MKRINILMMAILTLFLTGQMSVFADVKECLAGNESVSKKIEDVVESGGDINTAIQTLESKVNNANDLTPNDCDEAESRLTMLKGMAGKPYTPDQKYQGLDALYNECHHYINMDNKTVRNSLFGACTDKASCQRFVSKCFALGEDGFKNLGVGEDRVAVNGGLQLTPQASQPMMSGPACVKNSAFTADFEGCVATVNAYNGLVVAEKGLAAINDITLQNTRNTITARVAKSDNVAQAAIDGQREELRKRIDLNKRAYLLYSSELALLGTKVSEGVWSSKKNIYKSCDKSATACCKVLADEMGSQLAPNDRMRGYFATLLLEAGVKTMKLSMEIKELERQLAALEDLNGALDENVAGNDLLIEYCQSQQGMTDTVKCGNSGFNPNFTTNDFNGLNDDPEWGSLNVGGTNTGDALAVFDPIGSNSGADQSSIRDGLLDFDKKAENNGYLDNPGGASFKRGDGSASGGGGGGAGGGGGGAPSLSQKAEDRADDGSSLSKVEESGGYGSKKGGGGIYQKGSPRKAYRATASKDDKEVKNPFAGMFQNGKGESPVGPSNIALFEQISGRYGKVQEQNRIKK